MLIDVPGFHTALDMRTAIPRPFLAYYPAVIAQSSINETINFIDGSEKISSFDTGHPPQYSSADIVNVRESYDPEPEPEPESNSSSKAKPTRLGTLALGRSGDKGGNLNVGLFPTTNSAAHWSWLRRYMTISRMRELIGEDWDESYYIERVEFPRIRAVHFVVYGILGRGVSSSSRLDGFGKGFVDFIRDRVVEGPVGFGGSKI